MSDERLRALERENARLRVVCFGALALALVALLVALRTRSPDRLRVAELTVVDAQGRDRARLGNHAGGFGLLVSDDQGTPRALFGADPDGAPQLRLAAPDGQTLAELLVYRGAPQLSLAQPGGNDFFRLGLQVDGSSRLELADPDGRTRAALGASHDGAPSLVMVDGRGTPRVELGVSATDRPLLLLESEDGSSFRAPQ